jgi:hypothetical protein
MSEEKVEMVRRAWSALDRGDLDAAFTDAAAVGEPVAGAALGAVIGGIVGGYLGSLRGGIAADRLA